MEGGTDGYASHHKGSEGHRLRAVEYTVGCTFHVYIDLCIMYVNALSVNAAIKCRNMRQMFAGEAGSLLMYG